MSLPQKFTVFNPATQITCTVERQQDGTLKATWVQFEKDHTLLCTEAAIQDELDKGILTNMKALLWLH